MFYMFQVCAKLVEPTDHKTRSHIICNYLLFCVGEAYAISLKHVEFNKCLL